MTKLTREIVSEYLQYDSESGKLTRCGAWNGGQSEGHHTNGYLRISLGRLGVHYAHRLAWLLSTGSLPSGAIDHVDGNRLNNAWSNLRLATASQNSANCKRSARNTTGRKGVTRFRGMFRAQISCAGQRYWLGDHPLLADASKAYEVAADRLFGSYARKS